MMAIVSRLLLAAMLLGGALGPGPVLAQVGSNAATDRAVYINPQRMPIADEEALLRVLGETRMPEGRVDAWTYYPNNELGFVVQPEGRFWRDFRVTGSRWVHGILIALAVIGVALLAALRGSQDYERDPEGRRVLRFRAFDRFVHWLTAVSFVVLALTGLNIVFGRLLIQPWLGDPAFSALSGYGLIVHNAIGFTFLLGILLMTFMWMHDNFFRRVDLQWLRRGGGLFSGEHVPAEKFNAGQKGIFWIAVLGGLAMGLTGTLLLLPISIVGIGSMQVLHVVHTVVAALFIAVIIGHIYLGSWGVQGSFDAMWKGTVDLQWARTHHPLWIREGKAPPAAGGPSSPGSPAVASPEKR